MSVRSAEVITETVLPCVARSAESWRVLIGISATSVGATLSRLSARYRRRAPPMTAATVSFTVAPATAVLIARTSSNANSAPSNTRSLATRALKRVRGTLWRPIAASAASLPANSPSLGPTLARALPARSDSTAVFTAARVSNDIISGAGSGVHRFGLRRGTTGCWECRRHVSSESAVPSTTA